MLFDQIPLSSQIYFKSTNVQDCFGTGGSHSFSPFLFTSVITCFKIGSSLVNTPTFSSLCECPSTTLKGAPGSSDILARKASHTVTLFLKWLKFLFRLGFYIILLLLKLSGDTDTDRVSLVRSCQSPWRCWPPPCGGLK